MVSKVFTFLITCLPLMLNSLVSKPFFSEGVNSAFVHCKGTVHSVSDSLTAFA